MMAPSPPNNALSNELFVTPVKTEPHSPKASLENDDESVRLLVLCLQPMLLANMALYNSTHKQGKHLGHLIDFHLL